MLIALTYGLQLLGIGLGVLALVVAARARQW